MRITVFFFFLLIADAFIHQLLGQSYHVPLDTTHWKYDASTVEFLQFEGRSVVRNKPDQFYQIVLKDYEFENGTIEYDVKFNGNGFPGILFRLDDDEKNGENVYLRSFGPVTKNNRTTVQYAAVVDGMSWWDISDIYQSGASLDQSDWNHVRIVVHGHQMRIYINNDDQPGMTVPYLESGMTTGQIAFNGNVYLSNIVITPNATDGLNSEAGFEPTMMDPHYVRDWQVSEPIDFPFGRDLKFPLPSMYGGEMDSDIPDSSTVWAPLRAERRSNVNLSRLFGLDESGKRRLVWLKTSLHAESDIRQGVDLAFSDEVWIFLNGQLLHVDKNYYGTPSQKEPRGRASLRNSSFQLPLQEGDNEVLIAVANYFYGWGITMRLQDTQGLTFQ